MISENWRRESSKGLSTRRIFNPPRAQGARPVRAAVAGGGLGEPTPYNGHIFSSSVGPQILYLAVHLVESLAYPSLQSRLSMVGEVAR